MTPCPGRDPGLQPERTCLAWRRTALALALASALGVRFSASRLGSVVVVFGALGFALSLFACAVATHRYRRTDLGPIGELPDALPLASLAAVTVLLGAMAASYVFLGR